MASCGRSIHILGRSHSPGKVVDVGGKTLVIVNSINHYCGIIDIRSCILHQSIRFMRIFSTIKRLEKTS